MCYSFQLSVPGQEVLPAAGVTFVAVLPTHRRRGVLSSLMRRQLADVRDRGEPLAILWASEAVIYGRYGYGRASWHLGFTLRRGEGRLADARRPAWRRRPGAACGCGSPSPRPPCPSWPRSTTRCWRARPGMFGRNDAWWRSAIYDPAEQRQGASPLRCLLAEDASGPRGYALYSAVDTWTGFLPENVLTVRELMAADPAASAALCTDLLSRDLTTEFRLPRRPVDDPLLYQLADPRRTRPQLNDDLWVRIVDLPRALAGRRYSCPVDVVIEVRDEILPSNAGRWRLTTTAEAPGGGLAASCVPASRAGRPGAGRDRARRGLPGRHPAGRAGRQRPGRRAAARRRPAALGRPGLGPRPLVPHGLLGRAGGEAGEKPAAQPRADSHGLCCARHVLCPARARLSSARWCAGGVCTTLG